MILDKIKPGRKIAVIWLIFGIFWAGLAFGQSSSRFYNFHLYYTGESIVLDKDYTIPYEIISVDQNITDNNDYGDDADITSAKTEYSWKVVSTNGQTLDTLSFNPTTYRVGTDQQGLQSVEGKIVLAVPVYSDISFVNFYKNDVQILSVKIEPSPTYIPVNNISPSPSTTPPVARSPWKIILPLVIWFGLAIAVGVGWFLIKRRRQRY